jgi:hypothetical protein
MKNPKTLGWLEATEGIGKWLEVIDLNPKTMDTPASS